MQPFCSVRGPSGPQRTGWGLKPWTNESNLSHEQIMLLMHDSEVFPVCKNWVQVAQAMLKCEQSCTASASKQRALHLSKRACHLQLKSGGHLAVKISAAILRVAFWVELCRQAGILHLQRRRMDYIFTWVNKCWIIMGFRFDKIWQDVCVTPSISSHRFPPKVCQSKYYTASVLENNNDCTEPWLSVFVFSNGANWFMQLHYCFPELLNCCSIIHVFTNTMSLWQAYPLHILHS